MELMSNKNNTKIEGDNQPLKLNYKRTFLIGFAFFGILLLWQVYDSWTPTFLTELFKEAMGAKTEEEVQYLVGIIMAMDNLAALIMLPIFGKLSDKTHTKIGKRMPYMCDSISVYSCLIPLSQLSWNYRYDVNSCFLCYDV